MIFSADLGGISIVDDWRGSFVVMRVERHRSGDRFWPLGRPVVHDIPIAEVLKITVKIEERRESDRGPKMGQWEDRSLFYCRPMRLRHFHCTIAHYFALPDVILMLWLGEGREFEPRLCYYLGISLLGLSIKLRRRGSTFGTSHRCSLAPPLQSESSVQKNHRTKVE